MLSEPKADFGHHTQRGARASRAPTTVPMGRALRASPIGIVVFPFVCGVNVGGMCVCVCASLGLTNTLYLNNMFVYCTYIHTTYDFCMDNCG